MSYLVQKIVGEIEEVCIPALRERVQLGMFMVEGWRVHGAVSLRRGCIYNVFLYSTNRGHCGVAVMLRAQHVGGTNKTSGCACTGSLVTSWSLRPIASGGRWYVQI